MKGAPRCGVFLSQRSRINSRREGMHFSSHGALAKVHLSTRSHDDDDDENGDDGDNDDDEYPTDVTPHTLTFPESLTRGELFPRYIVFPGVEPIVSSEQRQSRRRRLRRRWRRQRRQQQQRRRRVTAIKKHSRSRALAHRRLGVSLHENRRGRSTRRFQGRQVNVTKSTAHNHRSKRRTDGRKDGRQAGRQARRNHAETRGG